MQEKGQVANTLEICNLDDPKMLSEEVNENLEEELLSLKRSFKYDVVDINHTTVSRGNLSNIIMFKSVVMHFW